MTTKTHAPCVAAAAALALALACAPREALAQLRLTALAGVEHLATNTQSPATTGTVRVEGTISPVPFVHFGAYGQLLTDVTQGANGASFGGMLALRPVLPILPVNPMVFASVGYLRYPNGRDATIDGVEGQLGGGLVVRANSFLDVELRAAAIQTFLRPEGVVGPTGFMAGGGLALRL